MQLWTDACDAGFGAMFTLPTGPADKKKAEVVEWMAEKWSAAAWQASLRITRHSMPYLEMYAVVAAALTWGHHWRGRFNVDCAGEVFAVNVARPVTRTCCHSCGC